MGWYKNQQERHRQAVEMRVNATYSFARIYLALDDERQEITVDSDTVNGKLDLSPKNRYRTFSYTEIESSEMYVELDSRQARGAAGAAVGAIIAGPAGAVIGGLARRGADKSKLKSAGIKVCVRGDEYDIRTVSFAKTGQDQIEKTLASTTAISDRLDSIIDGNKPGGDAAPIAEALDDIARLADMLGRGLITQAEFAAAKARVLEI